MNKIDIKDIFENMGNFADKQLVVAGWVKSCWFY